MRFDIVSINSSYSGIDRSLTTNDFLTRETKQYFDALLEMYFSYIDFTYNSESFDYDEKHFRAVQGFYEKFRNYNVSCELMVYNTTPLESVYDVPIEFLGIDIVKDMAESLISYHQDLDISVKRCLNSRGLFDDPITAQNAIDLLKVHADVWKPCWVYRVIDEKEQKR